VESLTWHRNFPDGLIVGGVFLGLGCGTFLTVPMALFLTLEWWWPAIVMPALVVLGVGAGVLERWWGADSLEFSRDGVGLVGDRRERFIALTDLTKVVVEHSGPASDGSFARTTVRLEIEGQPQVWVPGRFDPEVAAVLTRLLGPTVPVSEPRKVLPPGDSALPQ
jgi:hypothetical protein